MKESFEEGKQNKIGESRGASAQKEATVGLHVVTLVLHCELWVLPSSEPTAQRKCV